MSFSARRSLASGLSRHLSRRLRPSLSHLLPSYHDRSEDPSSSSAPPPRTQQPPPFPSGDLRRSSRSQHLTHPLPFGAHRNFSTTFGAEVDAAAGVLAGAASSVVPAFPAPFPGEVAAAAADSFLPVAAVQHLIDAVHSFTGLNWWASIALTVVLVRTVTIPLVVHQLKSDMKYNALRPEIKAIHRDILNSTDPRSKQESDKKLRKLFRTHGVCLVTPVKLLFIQVPIFLSFPFAIRNMVEKVSSLEGGGAYWFTDLTTPDQLYILPVLTSLVYAAGELNIKALLAGSPVQQMTNFNRVLTILILPLSMSFCKAHFFYWVPWALFSVANGFVFRMPAVRQYLNLPPVVPQPAPAAQVPTSKGPKPIPAVDSPPAVGVAEQSSYEPSDRIVDLEKKRRTPRVETSRVHGDSTSSDGQ